MDSTWQIFAYKEISMLFSKHLYMDSCLEDSSLKMEQCSSNYDNSVLSILTENLQ